MVLEAQEVLVALGLSLPQELEHLLCERARTGRTVLVLAPFPPPNIDQLARLVEAGADIHEEAIPNSLLIFLDRTQGYEVPTWEPVSNPVDRVYKLLWRRTGVYIRLTGVIEEIPAGTHLFKLQLNDTIWTWVAVKTGTAELNEGETVDVLALASWIGGVTPKLIHAVLIRPSSLLRR